MSFQSLYLRFSRKRILFVSDATHPKWKQNVYKLLNVPVQQLHFGKGKKVFSHTSTVDFDSYSGEIQGELEIHSPHVFVILQHAE